MIFPRSSSIPRRSRIIYGPFSSFPEPPRGSTGIARGEIPGTGSEKDVPLEEHRKCDILRRLRLNAVKRGECA